jgi:hypothetical protein
MLRIVRMLVPFPLLRSTPSTAIEASVASWLRPGWATPSVPDGCDARKSRGDHRASLHSSGSPCSSSSSTAECAES